MARQVNKLTALKVKALKEPGRYGDGDGLYLYVSPSGTRSWVFRYRDRTTSKHRDKGLGPLRDVTLEQARQAAKEARTALRIGVDPIDVKRAERSEKALERARIVTFGQCTDRYIHAHQASWRSEKHAGQWRTTLDTYAAGLLGMPVSQVETPDVLRALEPIWSTKTETATRVRQRIEAVLDWASARKLRTPENPARWRGHLDKLLPKPAKLKAVKPRAALPYTEIAAFLKLLRQRDGLAARALELQILTATRPSEVTGAKWEEFDLDNATWTIPADRMKASRAHRVPLSVPAMAALKALPRLSDAYVFPGARQNATLSTAAALRLLKELRPGVVPHGFRSSFRDWAADLTAFPREIAEQALAHTLSDKTEAAYRRSDLFLKRIEMMDAWAAYCGTERDLPTTRQEAV
jgi:integrase